MSRIKILTSFHKDTDLFVSDIVQPIQVGTDVNGVISEKYIRDNTGDHISAKNRMYCELTAQYWAWKNLPQFREPYRNGKPCIKNVSWKYRKGQPVAVIITLADGSTNIIDLDTLDVQRHHI